MKYVWAAIVLVVVAYAGYEYIRVTTLINVSEKLVNDLGSRARRQHCSGSRLTKR
jgi:hypothetical protein